MTAGSALSKAFESLINSGEGIAILLAGLAGFAAVAWQTRKGFEHLIKSQEKAAEIEKKTRIDIANEKEVARQAETKRQRTALLQMLQAELIALRGRLNHEIAWYEQQKISAEGRVAQRETAKSKLDRRQLRFPIYDSAISMLPTLEYTAAGDLVLFHNNGAVQAFLASQDDMLDPAEMVELCTRWIAVLKDWQEDVSHVIGQVSAARTGIAPLPPLDLVRNQQLRGNTKLFAPLTEN